MYEYQINQLSPPGELPMTKIINPLPLISKFALVGTAVFVSLNLGLDNQKAEAGELVLRCTASPYTIQINHGELAPEGSGYTYTAYDQRSSKQSPSLELSNGYKQDGRQGSSYIFKNGNYSYIVAKQFEGRGGQIVLIVKKSDRQISRKQCR